MKKLFMRLILTFVMLYSVLNIFGNCNLFPAMLDREEMEEPISERDENSPRPNEEDVFEEVGDRGEVLQEEPMLSVEPPTETPPPIPAPVPQPAPEVSTLMPEPKVEISEAKPPQLTAGI